MLYLSILINSNCFIRAFGYSSEDVQMIIESMAAQGKEPTFCMGDDIPLAILSQKPHMLYDYFKQRFAQVHWKFPFPDYRHTCECPWICCVLFLSTTCFAVLLTCHVQTLLYGSLLLMACQPQNYWAMKTEDLIVMLSGWSVLSIERDWV